MRFCSGRSLDTVRSVPPPSAADGLAIVEAAALASESLRCRTMADGLGVLGEWTDVSDAGIFFSAPSWLARLDAAGLVDCSNQPPIRSTACLPSCRASFGSTTLRVAVVADDADGSEGTSDRVDLA